MGCEREILRCERNTPSLFFRIHAPLAAYKLLLYGISMVYRSHVLYEKALLVGLRATLSVRILFIEVLPASQRMSM